MEADTQTDRIAFTVIVISRRRYTCNCDKLFDNNGKTRKLALPHKFKPEIVSERKRSREGDGAL